MEELIFRWSLVGHKSEFFKVTSGEKETFLNRFSSLEIGDDEMEFWQNGESTCNSFEEYWNEFIAEPFWLNNYPEYVHQDYKSFIREFLTAIDQDTLSSSEELQLDYWLDSIVNEY